VKVGEVQGVNIHITEGKNSLLYKEKRDVYNTWNQGRLRRPDKRKWVFFPKESSEGKPYSSEGRCLFEENRATVRKKIGSLLSRKCPAAIGKKKADTLG